MGVTGVCRGSRAVREARGDSLGAPRPSIVPDLAPPHGALVGGHDRTRALVPCGYAARCEWPAPSLPNGLRWQNWKRDPTVCASDVPVNWRIISASFIILPFKQLDL